MPRGVKFDRPLPAGFCLLAWNAGMGMGMACSTAGSSSSSSKEMESKWQPEGEGGTEPAIPPQQANRLTGH
jgi:hypothetical protein